MNIFYLDENPVVAAKMHCDKHVVKMCCEYAQLLSTTHRVLDGRLWFGTSANGRKIRRYIIHDNAELNSALYLACHENHPSTKWVRKSKYNYRWLFELWIALGKEYEYRYGKVHKSILDLDIYLESIPKNIRDGVFTQPTPAMKAYPHCIVEGDSITSYRNFYWEDKREFAKWTKRDKPQWWQEWETQGHGTIGENGIVLR
jgi:hypothetical protein